MSYFGIAGVQGYVSAGGGNLVRLTARVDQLMSVFPWVQMVVLSELSAHGPAHRCVL